MNRLALTLLIATLAVPLAATAAKRSAASGLEEGAVPAAKASKAEKKKKGAPKLTLTGGSGESPAERSARLKRECKGRPNAGACTGYTD